MKNSAAPAVKREAEEEWGKTETAITGRNRIMVYGPQNDGTYHQNPNSHCVALAISIPRGEMAVLKHFQARMPYGLFLPDFP